MLVSERGGGECGGVWQRARGEACRRRCVRGRGRCRGGSFRSASRSLWLPGRSRVRRRGLWRPCCCCCCLSRCSVWRRRRRRRIRRRLWERRRRCPRGLRWGLREATATTTSGPVRRRRRRRSFRRLWRRRRRGRQGRGADPRRDDELCGQGGAPRSDEQFRRSRFRFCRF